MSESLLEEIIQQENIIHAHIAAGKHKIRTRQEKRKQALENRYEELVKHLQERELVIREKEFQQNAQTCTELERRSDETISLESSLPEVTIHRLLKELLYKGLQRGLHDHPDDEG